ncbi:MAG: aminotransferase class III-fold pyridoxal phosphate-dependent enzyme, partial [Planctomycetia bacterium]|nr:aminotransferase class III-fold pyridoxal phosphate-dependent enzyme [Planctomycetia bacterium]
GAIGVGPIPGFHEQFASLLPSAHRAASPYCYRCPAGRQRDSCRCECFESMEHLVAEHGKRLAAIIVEPLCQAAAGMRIYPAEYLRRLRAPSHAEGLLLIADEIATGFGRVGEMFACDRAGISPDIMCVGKALTGGYLPMSATLVTEGIYDAFRPVGGRARTFYHGHTFCGNPLAAAVACASLDVYRTEGIIERTVPLARRLAEGMGEMSSLEPVADVRCLGMIGALEFSSASGASAFARRACAEARKRGALLRPLGGVIYLWPPLTISADELDALISIVHESVASAAKTKGTLH